MAEEKPRIDFTQIPGLETVGPSSSLDQAIIRAPREGEKPGLFERAIDALPKHLSEGLFGVRDTQGIRRGGVTETLFGGLRNAFNPNRVYENRRNKLLEEGLDNDTASDIAFRVVTGQSLEGVDDEIKSQLNWDDRVDKGFAALDLSGIGIGKGVSVGVGFLAKSPLKSAAGSVVNKFWGMLGRGGRQAAEQADEVFDVGEAIVTANKAKTTSKTAADAADVGDAARVAEKASEGKRGLDELADMFNEAQPTLKNKLKQAPGKTSKFYDRLRTEWTDRFTPIKNLVTKVRSTTGRDIDFGVDPYVGARLYQGVNGKIQNTLDTMGGFIKTAGTFGSQGQQNLSMFLAAERMAERAARGIKNPRGITKAQADEAAKLLETPDIKKAADGIKNITDDLLEQSRKAGLISNAAFKSIKANNQKYVPFDVLKHMDDNVDSVNKASGGFSVSEQNVVKALQGTDNDIADPLEALTRKIIQTTKLVERNEVAKKVANLAKIEGVDDVKKFDKDTVLEEGNDIFHVYEDGQKISYQAPRDVIESMKGMNREEADIVTGIVGSVNKVFRQSVTTLNIAFSIPNIFRDVQDAQLIAKHGFSGVDWARGLADAIGKGRLYKQWRQDGGAFSTYVSQATSARMTVKDISEGTAKRRIKTILNPLRLFEAIGSVSEEATRLAVYRGALRKGASRDFAAYEARQATVDFARSGTKMRTANLWVPFLNARLQGSLNLVRVSGERPGRLALRAAFMVGGPTVASYMYNRQFPEYYDIPQWEKDANFIIMNGTYQDENGETKPSYFKIPKGHIGRIVANPMENFMVMQDSESAEEWDKLALKLASDFSPVSFEDEGRPSVTAALSGVLTPLLKVPIEVHFANKDFFTGRDIVPRSKVDASSEKQFRDDTSDLAKDLGKTELAKTLELSPAGIDQYVNGFLGTLGRDAVKMFDTVRGEGALHDPSAPESEKIKQIPVINRFIGNRGGKQKEAQFEIIEGLRTEAADRRLMEDEIAKEIYETIRVSSAEGLEDILNDYQEQGMLTEGVERKLERMVKDKVQKIDAFDRQLKTLPTDERAKYILSVVKETPDDLLPVRLKEFQDKGILTKAVEEDIARLLSQ